MHTQICTYIHTYVHKDQKTKTNSWSLSFPRGPKLADNNTTQYIHTRQLEPQCPSSKMTTRELAGWLAGFGWLAEAQRGPEWPREAQRGRAGIEQACHAFGWKLPRSRLTTREAPQRFLYVTQEEAPADYYTLRYQTEIHFKPRASPLAE